MEQVAGILQRAGLYFTDLVLFLPEAQNTRDSQTKHGQSKREEHRSTQRSTGKLLSWLPLHTKQGDFEQEVNIRGFESTPGEALPPFSTTGITLDDWPTQDTFVIILIVNPYPPFKMRSSSFHLDTTTSPPNTPATC